MRIVCNVANGLSTGVDNPDEKGGRNDEHMAGIARHPHGFPYEEGTEMSNLKLVPMAVGESYTRSTRVLRLCSVKSRAKAQSENWVFSIARTRCRKRNVLCFQFTVVFPSWTSRVRIPSPAPYFQQLRGAHLKRFYLVYLEKWFLLKIPVRLPVLQVCNQPERAQASLPLPAGSPGRFRYTVSMACPRWSAATFGSTPSLCPRLA